MEERREGIAQRVEALLLEAIDLLEELERDPVAEDVRIQIGVALDDLQRGMLEEGSGGEDD